MQSVQTESRPTGGNNLLKQAIAVVFAIVLLFFAFRGCDFAQVWSYAKATNPLFLLLMCASCIVSHIVRAWRWIYLLEPIEGRRVSLWNSFCAVILGYAINVVVPRGGEVARLISISRSEKLPWVGVLPTMLIDRMLDLAVLGLLLGVTLTALPKEVLSTYPLLVPGGAALALGSVAGLFVLPFAGQLLSRLLALKVLKDRVPAGVYAKLEELSKQFEVGTKSLTNVRSFVTVVLLTPTIWFFYWLNFYLCVWAFHLEGQVTPLQVLIAFTIGTVGVLVPTPGSVGTFHLFVSQGLSWTAGLNKDLCIAYASVLHLFCFIVAVCIPAAICVSIQSSRANKAST